MTEALLNLSPGNPGDELVAIVAMIRSDLVAPGRLVSLLDHYGSAVDLLSSARTQVVEPLLAGVSDGTLEIARRTVSEWRQDGLDVRSMLDADYPCNLRAVYNRPALVFVEGRWNDEVFSRSVSVVGTRSASDDGRRRAFRLAKTLAEAGITVISGMAKGIDAAAHQGALHAGGPTVAVMGTGILERYPREHRRLAADIVDAGGALLSQFLPRQGPRPWTFPARNVTMSGLSLATVVIEAGATSGAKMQAEAALTHGRSVFLPSSLVQAHEWAAKLVQEGHRGTRAIEVSSPDEIVRLLELEPPELPLLSV